MNKIIKVSEETHKNLRVGSANSNLTMKDFVAKLADNNINGIPFDVDKHSINDLIAVFGDITIELSNREEAMTREQKNIYLLEIENIPFGE